MANKVTTTNTTNKVVITPQSTKKLTIDSGNSNNLTVNQSIPNNVQITNNDVDTSLTPNNVSISSTDNNVSLSTTSTPITVTQGTTSVVTVNTPGPQGPQGSGLTPGEDIEGRNITASGDISASGDLIVNGITASGDLFVSQYIKHIGDPDTFINFTDNRIRFKAGNIGFFDMEKDASVPYPATINPGGNRINFRVVDRNTELLLKTDSEASKVNLYHAGNQKLETTTDGINITGAVTASGNISSSGQLYGNILNAKTRIKAIDSSLEFSGNSLDFVDGDSLTFLMRASASNAVSLYYSGNKKLQTTSNGVNITGAVTASGDISSSGNIIGNTGRFNAVDGFISGDGNNRVLTSDGDGTFTAENSLTYNGTTFALQTQNIDMQAAGDGFDLTGNITASGDISASGDIEASGLILTSPNGTRYRITVEDDGTLNIS